MRSTKIIKICSSSLCTCLHHMVILRTRNKITDFLMILAWASPFNRSIEHIHLGLTITSILSWQIHIDKAILKANKIIYVMNIIKTKLPRNALCALYKSMLLPVIEYCDIIFDNCTIRAALALENVERRAALACTGAYKHISNDRLLLELNSIPLRQRRTNHKLVMLYKIIHIVPDSNLAKTQRCKWNEMNRALGHLCAHIG